MSKLDEQYTVNTSHLGLRLAGFIIAAVVMAAAFSFAIVQIGHKEPGYYEIEAEATDEAPLYRNGFHFVYYLDGGSKEIKLKLNTLEELYASVLLRSYKLLDTENTYEGFANLATLNQSLGEEIAVGGELLAILQDAWEKTLEARGMNLFAGALLNEWDSILALDDISEFDPATHGDIAERIRILAQETADLSHFSFEASPDTGKVRVTVSQEYLDFLQENEYGGQILTAGRLADAYRLALIKETLEAQGFTNGYLYTDSGLTLSLSGHEEGVYVLYGYEDGEVVSDAEIKGGANSACSFLRTFPMTEGEFMYHAAGEGRFYHPYFVMNRGDFADILLSSCVVSYEGDIVGACYENIALYNLTSREEIESVTLEGAAVKCTFMEEH